MLPSKAFGSCTVQQSRASSRHASFAAASGCARDVACSTSGSSSCFSTSRQSRQLAGLAGSISCAPHQVTSFGRGHDQDLCPGGNLLRTRRGHVLCAQAVDGRSADQPLAEDAISFAIALHKFSRPHTMIGTTISILSISALALQGQVVSVDAVVALAQALVSALLMNISIVGTNQLFDIEIDRINKPDLPLASGALTVSEGVSIVVATTLASLALGWASASPPLMLTLVVSWVLGILYSCELPFMRWKRSPLLAAGCILAVRAIIVQMGFYTHMVYALGGAHAAQVAVAEVMAGGPVAFTVGFMLFFSIVIALFKDIPDVKGDIKMGIHTLSVRIGVDRVFWTCIGLLTAAYAFATGFALVRAAEVGVAKTLLSCGGHTLFGALLWKNAREVNTQRKKDLTDFYMFIWKLFYAEYLIIPFLV